MARRARRTSMEQELTDSNNQLEIEEPVIPARPGVPLNMEDLVAALTAATRTNQERRESHKAPSYNGIGDVELFISQFQEVAVSNRWTDQDALIHLKGKLQDQARDCGKGEDTDTLFQNLRTRFGRTRKQARKEWDRIRKTKTQSFLDYGKTITDCLEIGYPNLGPEDRMDMALDKFIRNCGDLDLKRHLTTKQIDTISDAVLAADEFVGLEDEPKTRLSAISEEQNTLLDTLKLMQETLAELKLGSRAMDRKSDIDLPHNSSGNLSGIPNQAMIPQPMFMAPQTGNLSGIPNQAMTQQPVFMNHHGGNLSGIPNQAMTPQPVFLAHSHTGYHHSVPHMGFPGYLDNNSMMINQNQQMIHPKKSSAPRKLNCYQCGGPHMKRNCPHLQNGTGNSQSAGNTQQTLNSQGPTQ